MPVDPSIILGVKQPDPLDLAAKITGLQNAQNQNRQFQLQTQARQAWGNALTQATDPTTGQTDYGKAFAIASRDPAANYALGEIQTQNLSNQGQNLTNQTSAQKLASGMVDTTRAGLRGLPADPSAEDVINGVNYLAKTGAISKDVAAATLGSMPSDPTKLSDWVNNNFRIPDMGPAGAQAANYGTPSAVDTGGNVDIKLVNPVRGTADTLTTLPKTLTPAERMARISTYQTPPGGGAPQPVSVAASDLYDERGYPKPNAYAPGGALPVTPPAGVAESYADAAKGSSEDYQNLRRYVGGSSDRLFQLNQALKDLGEAKTGPASANINAVKSFLLSMAPDAIKRLGITQDQIKQVASYDEASKYLTQGAAASAAAFGPSTDSKLATALAGSPNTHISNLAATDVVKANIALERMKQAQLSAFNASGQRPDQFSNFSTQFATNTDPRAFALDLLSTDQRKKLIDGMSPAERKRFFDSLRTGINAGLPGLSDFGKH